MPVDLPTPIAIYIDAENRGDTEALAKCFAEDAVVRDEGETIEGLAAIKRWKAETKKKYQHTIEPAGLPCNSRFNPSALPSIRAAPSRTAISPFPLNTTPCIDHGLQPKTSLY